MRTLTEVFTPGAPTLPEGLRTLVVSPERELEPGMTVRAAFTFRNQGGAPASGVRVRMNLPEGLVYLVGTGQLDGEVLDDEQGNCPLLARNGAHIGDVAPGEERHVEISYSVAGAIENGTTIELQAAVAAFEIPPVGSNIVRLVARSHPVLENPLSLVSIESRTHQARPGGEVQVTLRVHNAGQSSAHDVVAVLPIPEHTSYIPNSVRVNGREIEAEMRMPFDRAYAPVVTKSLPASGTVTVTYRARIDEPLEDGTRILARATVASQETPALELAPATVVVQSAPNFEDEQTVFTIEPSHEVEAGGRITLRLLLNNTGTTAATGVTATLHLPDGLLLVRGASRIDGRPIKERKKESGVFEIGRIDAHTSAELSVDAVVATPAENGAILSTTIVVSWEPESQRQFERSITVRAQPFISPRRSGLARSSSASVRPGDEVEAAIALSNEGTAALTDAVLELVHDPALEDIVLLEKNSKTALRENAAEIDHVDPFATRRFVVRARVRSPHQDRAELRLGAILHSRELGQTQLGTVTYRVDSHPAFSAQKCSLGLLTESVLRPNQMADVYVKLINEGTDTAHDVRLRLYISPEARLETVDGATREKSSILFGEIAPGASVEARLGLRLLRSLAREFPVTIDGVLTATAILPVPLARLTIATTAEPDFSVGTLRSEPAELADVGETIEYALHVRNSGDGPARRVQITVESTPSLIYVPNSTTVNDVPVRDVGATPPLASERGIALNDVDPGVEALIAWREVVHNGLPAGESIVRVAHVRYDGERDDEILSGELKVRAAPSFANNIPGLPFGLDGMVGPSLGGVSMRALTGDEYVQLPPATPVSNGHAHADDLEEFAATSYLPLEPGHEPAYENGAGTTASIAVRLSAEELQRALKFLEQARFDGLVTHLFALRAFLATTTGNAQAQRSLELLRQEVRDILDRLFIKLRLPNYVLAERDIETPQLRTLTQEVFEELDESAFERIPAEFTASGSISAQELALVHDAIKANAHGAALWYAAALLIPGDAHLGMDRYRALLSGVLSEFMHVETRPFLDALQSNLNPELDTALDAVRTALLTPV